MSSILKALKKAEQNKKSNQNGTTSNNTILRYPEHKNSFFKSATPVILVSVICTTITYIVLAYVYKPETQNVPIATVPTNQPAIAVAPFKAITSAVTPFKNNTSAITSARKTVQQPISSLKPLVKVKNAPVSAAEYSKRKFVDDGIKKPVIKKNVTVMPAESLKVNGIALSDGETRQAVVNGITVSKGSYVGGAKVEDILQNRVRFSRGGIKFDVIVGDSGP